MQMQTVLKRVGLGVAVFISTVALLGCKGKDGAADDTDTIDPNLDQYIVTELSIQGMFDPQQIKVDAARGVIFVPQGGLGEEDTQGLPVLVEFDLATGLSLDSYGIISRLPSKLVVPSVTGNAVASVLHWEEERSEVSIRSLNAQAGISFDVGYHLKELKFNDQYLFTLNEARNQIHQYNATTGEHLGQIDQIYVNDWLIAYENKKLYILSNNEVTEYDFSQGAVTANKPALSLPNSTSSFGWLSPDETKLYQHNGEVFRMPEFENISLILSTFADTRRIFLDLAFVPNSDKHYTIESHSGVDGDVFLSPLANHKAEPLGLVGRRVFVTSAGVHLYAYEDGKHMLYTLKQNDAEAYKDGEIRIAPRLIRPAFNASRYAAHEAMYPVGLYAQAWSELFLRFNVVNMKDYYHSDRIIIEPICFNEGCASGTYSMNIPLERQPMHFTVHLADWFQVHDLRGLVGFKVRTPEGSWDNFELQSVSLSNIDPVGCNDIVDPEVLVFCDN